MTHMTEEDYLMMKIRTNRTFDEETDKANGGPESDLASKIRDYAKQHGYPCLIHPQSKKLSWYLPEGYADVVLSLPHGITLYLELKSKKGVWADNQKLMALQLGQLGHQYCKIKSFKEFLRLVSRDHLEFQGRELK